MQDTDRFMQEEFMGFYRRVLEAFKKNHQSLYTMISAFMGERQNRIGMRVTENGSVIGEYTLHLAGADVSHLENGALASEIHTPFGVIKPYWIIEKSVIEKMIEDEASFIANPYATKLKYFPEVTIKFLR